MLGTLGMADQRTSEGMYGVLYDVLRRADTGINIPPLPLPYPTLPLPYPTPTHHPYPCPYSYPYPCPYPYPYPCPYPYPYAYPYPTPHQASHGYACITRCAPSRLPLQWRSPTLT